MSPQKKKYHEIRESCGELRSSHSVNTSGHTDQQVLFEVIGSICINFVLYNTDSLNLFNIWYERVLNLYNLLLLNLEFLLHLLAKLNK